MEKQLIVIKVGTSSLTSADGSADSLKIKKICDGVADLRDRGDRVIVVSSGAIAAGFRKLGFAARPSQIQFEQASAAVGQVLLMDEPFSALDEFTREKLHIDLLKIWRKTNKTVIFVTHNISESVFLSDRVCVLSPHPGRLSAVVDIDLPRPRTLDMTDTQEFTELVARVRGSFEGV